MDHRIIPANPFDFFSTPLQEANVLSIRPATAEDTGLLATMIRELAEFERELDWVSSTEADLVRDGFGGDRKFRAVIAEWHRQAAGYAFCSRLCSTWQGLPSVLDSLFARPLFCG